MPPAVRSRAIASMMKRWWSANATIRPIMPVPLRDETRRMRRARRMSVPGTAGGARGRDVTGSGAGRGAGRVRRVGADGGARRGSAGDDAERVPRGRERGDAGGDGIGGRQDQEDDVVVVGVIVETSDPRGIGRARVGQRNQGDDGGEHGPRDGRSELHDAVASGSFGSWPRMTS